MEKIDAIAQLRAQTRSVAGWQNVVGERFFHAHHLLHEAAVHFVAGQQREHAIPAQQIVIHAAFDQTEHAVLVVGVVAEVAERVAVMYTGKIVEESPVDELFARPKHPYTEGLLRSVPKLTAKDVVKAQRLQTIEGTVPKPTALPPGCHFEPRCHYRMPRCKEGEIPLYPVGVAVMVRCVLYDPALAYEMADRPRPSVFIS